MDIKQKSKTPSPDSKARATYSSPKLAVYGPVGALTQAGTMGNVEMSTMGGPMAQMMSML